MRLLASLQVMSHSCEQGDPAPQLSRCLGRLAKPMPGGLISAQPFASFSDIPEDVPLGREATMDPLQLRQTLLRVSLTDPSESVPPGKEHHLRILLHPLPRESKAFIVVPQ